MTPPLGDAHSQGEQAHVLHHARIAGLGAIPGDDLADQIGGEALARDVVVNGHVPQALLEERVEDRAGEGRPRHVCA